MTDKNDEVIQSGNQSPIYGGTNVRVSLGAIASLVVGITIFLYAEIQRVHYDSNQKISNHKEYSTQKFDSIEESITRKADKKQTEDRYTGRDADKDSKATSSAIKTVQNDLSLLRGEVNRRFEHNYQDMLNHKNDCSKFREYYYKNGSK